ncbi:pollen-specific leucine-rich repeat extensin-like protein 4 [Iris pallida]|uniref:Pollen-specific leucine-rich repeat extensin-like protein 4 n=1 Tax=Iris pallida TaxID=29817 RepID=A0AAX6GQT6_IRIPA|nr:pollen-specific leucine-rich repeat extensin-like protein 4 [Iris pallida]
MAGAGFGGWRRAAKADAGWRTCGEARGCGSGGSGGASVEEESTPGGAARAWQGIRQGVRRSVHEVAGVLCRGGYSAGRGGGAGGARGDVEVVQ